MGLINVFGGSLRKTAHLHRKGGGVAVGTRCSISDPRQRRPRHEKALSGLSSLPSLSTAQRGGKNERQRVRERQRERERESYGGV